MKKIKDNKEGKGDYERGKEGNTYARTHQSLTEEVQEKPPKDSNKGQKRGSKKSRQCKYKARSSDGMVLDASQMPKQTSQIVLSVFESRDNVN